MINLCPTTYEIASKMKNFSKWVRLELLKQHSDREERQVIRYNCPACWKPSFRREGDDSPMYCMNKDCGYITPLLPEEIV